MKLARTIAHVLRDEAIILTHRVAADLATVIGDTRAACRDIRAALRALAGGSR